MILILDNLQFHYNVYQILCLFMSQQVHTGDWRNKWNVIFLITYQTIAEINQICNTLKRIYNSRAPLIDPSSFLSLQVWELHTYYTCCSIFLIVYQAFNCPLKWWCRHSDLPKPQNDTVRKQFRLRYELIEFRQLSLLLISCQVQSTGDPFTTCRANKQWWQFPGEHGSRRTKWMNDGNKWEIVIK